MKEKYDCFLMSAAYNSNGLKYFIHCKNELERTFSGTGIQNLPFVQSSFKWNVVNL